MRMATMFALYYDICIYFCATPPNLISIIRVSFPYPRHILNLSYSTDVFVRIPLESFLEEHLSP